MNVLDAVMMTTNGVAANLDRTASTIAETIAMVVTEEAVMVTGNVVVMTTGMVVAAVTVTAGVMIEEAETGNHAQMETGEEGPPEMTMSAKVR